jgi:hypothetical protein
MGATRIFCIVVVVVFVKDWESVPASTLKLFDHLADFILRFAQLLLKPS